MTAIKENKLFVHLVGSIPLQDNEAVFRTVSDVLGPHLRRLPDGETGERRFWIGYVRDLLARHPDLVQDTSVPPFQLKLWNGTVYREMPLLRFREGVDPSRFDLRTRYADMALDSYAVFQRLQSQGVIPKGIRFQVALPTPLAITYNYISPASRKAFIASYTARLLDEVATIVAHIAADHLSIQWDVLQEIMVWENYYGYRSPDYKDEITSVLTRISDAVPAAVDLGFHYCYGSPGDEHLVQPMDTGVMVELTNLVVPTLRRPLNFLHLPVPKDRVDDAYYRPLKDLHLARGTEIYLGLVHLDDSQGNRARLSKARQYVDLAGVATECGWGRGGAERVPRLLEAHRELVAETVPTV